MSDTRSRSPWTWLAIAGLLVSGCDVNPRASDTGPVVRPTMTSVWTSASTAASPVRDSGVSFPGKQAKDYGTYAGQAVTYGGGVSVVSEALKVAGGYGWQLCSTVTISNSSNEAVSFNPFDWKLQNPAGVINDAELWGKTNELDSGQLASGGSVAGDVCFPFPAKSSNGMYPVPTGTWVVLLEPSMFSGERIAWVNKFADATTSTTATERGPGG